MLLSSTVIALASTMLVLADGCAAPPASTTTAEATVTGQQQSFTRLFSQSTSGYPEPAEEVIRDRRALEAVWRALHSGNQGAELPAVDFARSTLVLIAVGERSTGGHAIRVDRVTRKGDAAIVHYTVTRPGPGCMTTQVMTAPAELISIPRIGGEVRFQPTSVVEPC